MQSETAARLRWLVLQIVFAAATAQATQPRYQLLGLQCGTQDLLSPTVLSAGGAPPLLSDICRGNFRVAVRDLRPAEAGKLGDDLVVVVEHSHAPIPAASGSTVLLTAPVAPGKRPKLSTFKLKL